MLTHKIAVVTGGSRGLGRATVERFAQEGAIVLTGSTREPDTPLPAGVHWQHLDVQDSASIDALIRKVSAIARRKLSLSTSRA